MVSTQDHDPYDPWAAPRLARTLLLADTWSLPLLSDAHEAPTLPSTTAKRDAAMDFLQHQHQHQHQHQQRHQQQQAQQQQCQQPLPNQPQEQLRHSFAMSSSNGNSCSRIGGAAGIPVVAPSQPRLKPLQPQQHPLKKLSSRADSFHVIHKVPAGDTPYVKAKHVELVDKDPDCAIALFWAAINAGDRVDSALKDMEIVMKQQNRAEEVIEAIKSLRCRCSENVQESIDKVLLDLYKRCGRLNMRPSNHQQMTNTMPIPAPSVVPRKSSSMDCTQETEAAHNTQTPANVSFPAAISPPAPEEFPVAQGTLAVQQSDALGRVLIPQANDDNGVYPQHKVQSADNNSATVSHTIYAAVQAAPEAMDASHTQAFSICPESLAASDTQALSIHHEALDDNNQALHSEALRCQIPQAPTGTQVRARSRIEANHMRPPLLPVTAS